VSKILCIVDSYSWALFNRAKNLKKQLKSHEVIIKHFNDTPSINFNNFDIVYSLNWPIHGYIKGSISSNRKYRLVTTISSHIGRGNAKTMSSLLNKYDAISTSSEILYNEFRPIYKGKVFNTSFGVNSDLFVSKNSPGRHKNVFGWVGNHSRDVKRFNVISSTFKKLGPKYILKTAKAGSGLSRKQMVSFYNSVGTVICFSSSEGTPNPILEAASCGRSIISTKVGNVPELVGGNRDIHIVSNKAQLRDAIIYNSKNPIKIDSDGKYLRGRIVKSWSWNKRAKAFVPFLGLLNV